MYTPTKRAQPSWALQSSAEREKANRRGGDKGKNHTPGDGRTATSTNTTEVTKTVVENTVTEVSVLELAPPIASLDGEALEGGQSEPEIWRRFQELGTLDVESLEKKDRAALLGRVSTLEAELYDYQYNMGLLLLERKNWTARSEELKAAILEAEENTQREQAAHLIALEEAGRREDILKKSLDIEQQCVLDLEKALNEMRAEASEVTLSAENQMTQARELAASVDQKLHKADGKLFEAQAVHAEASRKHADSQRKVQEVEAREDALRRERQSLIAEIGGRKRELDKEEESLKDWEGRLQEGRDRIHEGERLLNQREQTINQRDENLKQLQRALEESKSSLEKGLEESRIALEKERSLLEQLEVDLNTRVSSVMEREQTVVAMEISLEKKEQELLLAQEKLAGREQTHEQLEQHIKNTEVSVLEERDRLKVLKGTLKLREESLVEQRDELVKLQMMNDEQRRELIAQNEDIELAKIELEKEKRILVTEQEAFEARNDLAAEKLVELAQKEEKITQRELQVDQRSEKISEREQNLGVMFQGIEEKERIVRSKESAVEAERRRLHLEEEKLKVSKEEVEDIKAQLELERHQVQDFKEKLRKEHELETHKIMVEKEELKRGDESAKLQLKEEKESLRQEIETMKLELKEEKETLKQEIEHEKQQIEVEKERLKIIEEERKELLLVQKQLKVEIDDFRARKQHVMKEFDDLKTEKERFEREWELLDEKREDLKKERERYNEESRRMTQWFTAEEERLKLAKEELHGEFLLNTTDLSRERDAFVKRMEKERVELFARVEKEKEELVKSVDLQRAELERSIEKDREQLNKLIDEREVRLMKDVEREKEKVSEANRAVLRDSEQVRLERLKLERERQEILNQREDAESEWLEIRKDIDELQIQREKLKEQREALHQESAQILREKELVDREAEALRRMKHDETEGASSLRFSEKQQSGQKGYSADHAAEVLSPPQQGQSVVRDLRLETTPVVEDTIAVDTSSTRKLIVSPRAGLGWLRACLFKGSENNTPSNVKEFEQPALQPSRSFNQSQIAEVAGLEVTEKANRRSAKRLKRTDSVQAAVQEARNYVEHQREWTNPDHRDEETEQERDEVISQAAGGQWDAVFAQQQEQGVKGKEEIVNDVSSQPREQRGGKSGRKRRRLPTKDTEIHYVEDDESDSDAGGTNKRKRRFKDIDVLSGLNGDSGGLETPRSAAETPGGRRYNLRRSTLINTKATQAGSAVSAEDRETSGHQERSQKKKTPPLSIPEASGELPEVSSPSPTQVAVGARQLATITTVVIEKTVIKTEVTNGKEGEGRKAVLEVGETSGEGNFQLKERTADDFIVLDQVEDAEEVVEGEDQAADLIDTKGVEELAEGYQYGLGGGDGSDADAVDDDEDDGDGHGDGDEDDVEEDDKDEAVEEDMRAGQDEDDEGDEEEEEENEEVQEGEEEELDEVEMEQVDDEDDDNDEQSSDSNSGDAPEPTIRQKNVGRNLEQVFNSRMLNANRVH